MAAHRPGGGPERRCALLCLPPDVGHVVPLLRVGRQAHRRGYRVTAFAPAEVGALLEGHGVRHVSLGPVRPPDFHEGLQRYLELGPLGQVLFHRGFLAHDYHRAMGIALLESAERWMARLREYDPDLLVADAVLFDDLARAVAAELDVPLLLHYCEGTHRRASRPVVRHFGPLPGLDSAPADRAFRGLRRVARASRRRWQRWRDPDRWEETRARVRRYRELRDRLPAGPPGVPVVTTGIGVLERRHLGCRLPAAADYRIHGPLPPLRTGPLDPELQRWLEAEGPPVVFISLGTMVRPGSRVAATLLQSVDRSGLRAVWAWGKGAPPETPEGTAGRIRFEPWIPQPELLAHPGVAAVLTHGGAGTVQEALWFGKPMVGIPWAWDQRYNVRQVERLGAGIRLSRGRLRAGATARALRSAATSSRLRSRAAALGGELRASEGSGQIMELVEELSCR